MVMVSGPQARGKKDWGLDDISIDTSLCAGDQFVWFEGHDEVTKAIARKKQLKGWKRIRKIELIEAVNPAWVDLSREWYDCEPADYRRALDRMNT